MCRYPVERLSYDSSNTKAFLLLQAHFSRLPLPCADYYTDLKSVLDQSIRILQAMIDVVAERGFLSSTLQIIQLLQMILQGRWIDEPAVLTLPYIEKEYLHLFLNLPICLPLFCATISNNYSRLSNVFLQEFLTEQVDKIHQVAKNMPVLCIDLCVQGDFSQECEKKIEISPNVTGESLELLRDHEYTLTIGMRRKNYSQTLKVHCPRFHRGKDESWFLILGDIERRELLALKRVSGINGSRKIHYLQFTTSKTLGPSVLQFFVMSDSYMALDQQYTVLVNVIE